MTMMTDVQFHAPTAKTRLYGLLGHPVGHSLSPVLHNRFFAENRIDGVYLAFDVLPEKLGEAVAGLKAMNLAGANVTIPHKESVMAHLDAISDEAFLAGAVNTIVREVSSKTAEVRYVGHNTDGAGLLEAISKQGVEIAGRSVSLIGAGGAAKGILAALVLRGVSGVKIYNRSLERAEGLVTALSTMVGHQVPMECHTLSNFPEHSHEIIIQTTSVGMGDGKSPVDATALTGKEIVCDIVYKPQITPLLETALSKGCTCIYGKDMLFYQAMLAEMLWQGRQFETASLKNWFDGL